MDYVQVLLDQYFSIKDSELCIQGLAIADLARQYGTPFFVYDEHILEHTLGRLRKALPSQFSVFYSIKANPNPHFLQFFIRHGCGLEIASLGEFHRALDAGCAPENILFAGPGKTEAELEAVLSKGIGEIHAESALEIKRIAAIADRLNIRAHVALRVNPTGEAQGGAMRMGGKPLAFGVDEEQLPEIIHYILSFPQLEFQGIHLFAGTQILDHAVLINQYRKGLAIAKRVAEHTQRPLATIDFGGGLGIPYFAHEQALDLDALHAELHQLMDEIQHEPHLQGTRFLIEPGRYLAGESGIYVARVNDIKISRGKKFLILDGGMHHHLAASGNLGQTIKRNYPIAVLNKLGQPNQEDVEVVGPLCTPLDTLGRSLQLPAVEVGDLIGIFQSGAYARSASPLGFLSQPTPPEVWIEQGVAQLITQRALYATC
ncbi:MAG TPA: type III PLP-dependent enzyme [Chroococcidiopsis sp.]